MSPFRHVRCLLLFGLLTGCAVNETRPPLIEARVAEEERALTRFETGELREAARNFERASRLAELADDPDAIVENRLNLGMTYVYLDELDAAALAFADAYRVATREGNRMLAQRVLLRQAELAYRRGELETATSRYRSLLDGLAESGAPTLRQSVFNGLALCALAQGDFDAAERFIGSAEAIGPGVAAGLWATTRYNRATLALRRRDPASAERAALEALAIDRDRGDTPSIAADLELLGWIYAQTGRQQQAYRHFDQARRLYRHLGMASAATRLERRLAEPSTGRTEHQH